MSACSIVNGYIHANGKRVREFGINCSDLFADWRRGVITSVSPVAYTPPANYIAVMDFCAANNIRFIRFLVSAHRTKTYRVGWMEAQATFLSNMDALVAAAEERGILLVPSIFFSQPAIPPRFSEPLRAYDDPLSLTYAQIAADITAIVGRYKNSPAIGYWEYGNESDLRTDNPPAAPSYSTDTSMEQPAAWSVADGYLTESTTTSGYSTIGSITKRFKDLCLVADPNALTCSGNSGWRVNSQRADILEAMRKQLADDGTHTTSAHPYPNVGFHVSGADGLGAYMLALNKNYRLLGKPLIIGEFGFPAGTDVNGATSTATLEKTMIEIIRADIDIAMIWEYRAFSAQTDTYSISDGTAATNEHLAVFLKACQQYNL